MTDRDHVGELEEVRELHAGIAHPRWLWALLSVPLFVVLVLAAGVEILIETMEDRGWIR